MGRQVGETESVGDITLASEYWDCECVENYIHPKSKPICGRCQAKAEDQPDSRANEVAGMLADMGPATKPEPRSAEFADAVAALMAHEPLSDEDEGYLQMLADNRQMTKREYEAWQARETADRVVEFKDPAEAAELPGLLGRMVPALLKCNGWYAANVDGVKTLYVLQH